MIGEVLRKARKAKHYTMAELAAMVGVTAGYISNLEKNRLEPSLTLLRELCDKLDIPPSTMIMEENVESVTLMRSGERPFLKFSNLPCMCEVLTPLYWHCADTEELEAIRLAPPPGTVINLEDVSRDADICVYVLSGEITYHYGDCLLVIESDGSVFIPRNTVCRIENTGQTDAVMIWITKALFTVRQAATIKVKREEPRPAESANPRLKLVGERIRELRKSYGIPVKTFAEIVGVTPAYISQIERNLTEPSLRVLRRIAKELKVELTLLFASDMPANVMTTAGGKRDVLTIADGNALVQLLVPYHTADERSPDMSVVLVELGPGQADSDESIVHDYDEFCIVLEGSVEYQTPEGVYALSENDCLYIRKGIHHTIYNPHDSKVKMLVVLGSVLQRKLC